MAQTLQDLVVTSAFTLTTGLDVFIGTEGDDVFNAAQGTLNTGDSLTGRSGNDTLQLIGGANINTLYLTNLTFSEIETILGSTGSDYIIINANQLTDVLVIDGNGGSDTLLIRGTAIDLTGKTLIGISSIYIGGDTDATITMDSVETAMRLSGSVTGNDHLVLTSGSFTDAQRSELYNHFIDTITAEGVTMTNTAPTVSNLNGDKVQWVNSTPLRLDAGLPVQLSEDDGNVRELKIRVINGTTAVDIVGLDTSTGTIALSDGLNNNSRVLAGGLDIGYISTTSLGSNVGLDLVFNTSATPERVQLVLQALTYQHAGGDLRETKEISISVFDPAFRTTTATVTVIGTNIAPTVTLNGATSVAVVEGKVFSGVLVPTDDVTPASQLALSFDSTAPGGGNAGGLLVIEGTQLKLATGRTFDYDALPSGEKFVTAYVKVADIEGGVTTQAIQFNILNNPQDDGTDGNDTIIGGSASEILNGKLGNDVVLGNSGNDTLYGGGGNDKLNGGYGKDTLYGGSGTGRDIFVFDTKPSSTNVDKIADYNVTYDSIQLDNKVFTKLGSGTPTSPKKLALAAFWKGAAAHDATDRIIYDPNKGYLYYDADGTGVSKQVLIATMAKYLKMNYAEFYVI